MLSANPQDRPSAAEVQQQIYGILTECCNITEPHCVHDYHVMEYAFSQMRIVQGINPNGDAMSVRPNQRISGGYSTSPRRMTHQRFPSGGAMSNSASSSSGSETGSQSSHHSLGQRDPFAPLRSIKVPARSPSFHSPPPSVYASHNDHAHAHVY
jgi:hypothetical protein